MTRKGASVALGMLLLVAATEAWGCFVTERDVYPDGVPRESSSTGASSGTGGSPSSHCNCPNSNYTLCASYTCDNKGECMPPSDPQPAGLDCYDENVCDGEGKCVSAMGLAPLGAQCTSGDKCYGKDKGVTCAHGTCRLPEHSRCTDDIQCVTNFCSQGSCEQCSNNGQCKTGLSSQNSGICDKIDATSNIMACKAAVGEPCNTKMTDCFSTLQCKANYPDTTGICLLGDMSQDKCDTFSQCNTKYCNPVSNKCTFCNTSKTDECTNKSQCIWGHCDVGLPADAYCISDVDCKSKRCTGFPRRCQ